MGRALGFKSVVFLISSIRFESVNIVTHHPHGRLRAKRHSALLHGNQLARRRDAAIIASR